MNARASVETAALDELKKVAGLDADLRDLAERVGELEKTPSRTVLSA